MTDYTDAINQVDNAAPTLATTALDQNPDDGARALQLASATGVAPQVVHADLVGFEKEHRANLTQYLVRNNSQIASYVRGNPLADVVSNDDYGNLDQFSRSVPDVSWLHQVGSKMKESIDPWANIAEAGIKGAYAGGKEALTEPYKPEDVKAYMEAGQAKRLLYSAGDLGSRVLNALAGATFGGAGAAAEQTAREVGASEAQIERAGRETRGILESEMMRTGEHAPHEAMAPKSVDPITMAKPWTDAGLEPPRGVHPEIDSAKAQVNAEALAKLDANLADAQASLTKVRSPDLFNKFTEQHYADTTISISGDRVAELYGDRMSDPGDGILGWVDGIGDKLEAARAAGDDVHIPLADWMAKVDPKVAKDLHDDTRVWPGGITAREAAEPWEAKPVVEAPIAQARAVSGTEPMFAQGDRKLTLTRLPDLPETPEMHDYQFVDRDGNPAGEISIVPNAATKELYIANIMGKADLGVNSFGPSLMRDIKRQLSAIYPEYETITGHRLSGARYEAGKWMGEGAHPIAKLQLDTPETKESYQEFRNGLGEVGQRKYMAAAAESGESISGEVGSDEFKARMDNLRAGAVGLDVKTFNRMQRLLQARFDADIEASLARAERDQARIQTKEWKANEKELAKQVEETIRQRPDVMADLLVSGGELGGKKLRQRYPLRAEDLTAEQKAALPRHYYAENGLPVDAAAKMVGFTSGDAMVEKLVEYNRDKGTLSAKEHLARVVEDETNRQMAERHGDLQKNIMLDAQDQALSENNLNLLAEEWQGAAMQAGITVVDKDTAKDMAKGYFDKMKVGEVDSGRLMTQMLKHYQDAIEALIGRNPASAVVSLQRRFITGLWAADAKKLEQEQRTFNRTAKQFSKRDVPSVEPEYVGFIHGILMQVGKQVRRSVQDLEKQIEAGESKTLQEFVGNKTASLREIPVWDQLYDGNWRKAIPDMTTEEFRNVNNSVKTLVHNGRDEMKIYKQGEAADYAEVKRDLIDNIAEAVGREVRPVKKPGLVKNYYVRNLQMENIFNRWDAFDAKGKWNQYVMRDLIDGANQVDAWKKEYAAKIKKLDSPKGLGKAVDNPLFKDMDHGAAIPFTRKNLISVMLNTGTQSNLVKLAKGYGLEPADVMNWVHGHATAEDWKFTQGVWDIFKDIKAKSDTMYRSLTGGVPAEDVMVSPVQTPHGTFPGGYYPIIFHAEMEGKSKTLLGKGPLVQTGYVRAATPAGYTKSRSGYVAPLALDLDQMPGRMAQMLHDIGLRPAVLNASKVFYDKEVRSAVRKYFGDEYRDGMISYLQAVANSANRVDKAQSAEVAASEFVRQNVITTLVGLNPGTVLKHGPSALVTSIREVGPIGFAKAVTGLMRVNAATGESNWQFAIKNSLELQRRDRNWQETLYGAASGLTEQGKFPEWRQRIMEWSSKPVAISDMLSAVPTWMAAYEKEMGISGVHGDAVYAADRAVRRAHGSTAITSRTAIQRDWSPWLTSVYNYFSDIMNRQMETIWKAGDSLDMVKEGDYKAAMKTVPALTGSLFAYAIWPAIVENLVSPSEDDPKDPWVKKAAIQAAFTASSSWPGVRDVATALIHGKDPQYGLTGTAGQELYNTFRDFNKDHPFRKDHAGKMIQDAAGFVGLTTGMLPAAVGKAARYGHDVAAGVEHPKTAWAWLTGLRFGKTEGHSTSVQNYLKGVNR